MVFSQLLVRFSREAILKSLRIVNDRCRIFLDLYDEPGTIRIAEFTSPRAVKLFEEMAAQGIKLQDY